MRATGAEKQEGEKCRVKAERKNQREGTKERATTVGEEREKSREKEEVEKSRERWQDKNSDREIRIKGDRGFVTERHKTKSKRGIDKYTRGVGRKRRIRQR